MGAFSSNLTCPLSFGFIVVLRAACGVWAFLSLMGEERCRGILKVVALPWLTESSSESIWKKGQCWRCPAEIGSGRALLQLGMKTGMKWAVLNCLCWEIKQWKENESYLCSVLCSPVLNSADQLSERLCSELSALENVHIGHGVLSAYGCKGVGFLSWDVLEWMHWSHSLEQCKSVSIWSPASACFSVGPAFGAPSYSTLLFLEHCIDPEGGCTDIPPVVSIFPYEGLAMTKHSFVTPMTSSYK